MHRSIVAGQTRCAKVIIIQNKLHMQCTLQNHITITNLTHSLKQWLLIVFKVHFMVERNARGSSIIFITWPSGLYPLILSIYSLASENRLHFRLSRTYKDWPPPLCLSIHIKKHAVTISNFRSFESLNDKSVLRN